jgi:hypothetical protein
MKIAVFWNVISCTMIESYLDQWCSTRGKRTSWGKLRQLRGYVKFKKRKYYFIRNTAESGSDLGLATGDLDVNTFVLGAPFLCPPPPMQFLSGRLVSFYSTWCVGT